MSASRVKRKGATRRVVPQHAEQNTVEQPSKKPAKPARPDTVGPWFRSHRNAIKDAWKRLRVTPLATFMTIIVIATALTLPAALHLLIKNAQTLGNGFDNSAQISLYLTQNTTLSQAEALAEQLQQRPDVEKIDLISREQALDEFQSLSGFNDALKTLDSNPLPHLLVLHPSPAQRQPAQLASLQEDLQAMDNVDIAQLDMAWLERLFRIISILEQSTTLISIFLTFAVILVIGNTIRLMNERYRDEIDVLKLVGATDSFVRRPFLYAGIMYGLTGACFALLAILLAQAWISVPVNELAALYQSEYSLFTLSLGDAMTLLATGLVLGWGGSWAVANHHLKSLE